MLNEGIIHDLPYETVLGSNSEVTKENEKFLLHRKLVGLIHW